MAAIILIILALVAFKCLILIARGFVTMTQEVVTIAVNRGIDDSQVEMDEETDAAWILAETEEESTHTGYTNFKKPKL